MKAKFLIGLLIILLILPVGASSAQESDRPAGCAIELEALITQLVQAQRAADTGNTYQAVQTLDDIQAQIADLVERCEGVMFPMPQTYTASDGSIAFNYPTDWRVVNPDSGVYLLANSTALASKIQDDGLDKLEPGEQALIVGVLRLGEEIGESITYAEYVETFVDDELDTIGTLLGPVSMNVADHTAQRFTVQDEDISGIFDLADFTGAEQPAVLIVAGVAPPGELTALTPIVDAFEKHLRYPAEQSLRVPGVALDTLTYTQAIPLMDFADGIQPTAVLAPDGSALAWFAKMDNGAICVLTIDDLQTICTPIPEQWRAPVTRIAWSPDAAYIAWAGDFFRYFKEADILLYEVATGAITNPTDDGIEDWEPFGGSDEPGPLWLDTVPTWGVDGYLYFIRDELEDPSANRDLMQTGLYRLDPASGQVERVRDLTGYFDTWVIYPPAEQNLDGSISLSPDASQIAFIVLSSKLDEPTNGVYVMDLAGDAPPVQVMRRDQLLRGYPDLGGEPPIMPQGLTWTAEGDGLIVWSGIFAYGQAYAMLHVVDLATQEITPLFDFSGIAEEDMNEVDETTGYAPAFSIPRAVVLAPDGVNLLVLNLWEDKVGLTALEWVEGQYQVKQTRLFETDEIRPRAGSVVSSTAARDGTLLLQGVLFLPGN